ncbi:MAG TPA: protein kinase, partial [Polyangiaceae bacterium]|nr:protein kinase [Polyangiaceae bacterium]
MREGDVIAGRYRILAQAGAGGMGTVFQAADMRSGIDVALKTLRPDAAWGERTASRLRREAAALSEIRHSGVVRYVDHGEAEGGQPFLVMEWVAGENLAERLERAPLTPAEALRLSERLASGLAASHAADVVHRDLKPSNVMLADRDLARPVIVDFGVARLAGPSDLTAQGANVGTPRYMAPEQIRNARTVDGRADVFALGCILFEALTGRPCFEGDDPVGILARVLFEPLPVPTRVRANLPARFDALLHRLLDRDTSARPTAAVARELVQSTLARLEDDPGNPSAAISSSAARHSATLDDSRSLDVEDDVELVPSLRLGDNALVVAAERGLPRTRGSFIGRSDEEGHVVSLLRTGCPIVVVWGGPGIGKTRLALEVVKHIAREDPARWDVVVFADLAAAEGADDIVRLLAREAGLTVESSSAPEIAVGRALGKLGRALVIADSIEHVATPLATTLSAFVRVAPLLQVVATSRRRWAPPGAIGVELGPLSTAVVGTELSPAAQLFVERAREYLPAIDSDRTGPASTLSERAERIARALDGVPLALELSASSVHVLGLEGVVARTAPESVSPGSAKGMLEGPMRAALDQSYQSLTLAERATLGQCAVFRGGFSAVSAEAVVNTTSGEPVLTVLQSLRDHSLLKSDADAAGEVRLSMFAAVREYAWEKLDAAEASGALARHAAHFASFDAKRPEREDERLTRLERDAENLLAAAEFSLSDDDGASLADGLRALIALEPAIYARGALASFTSLLDRAILRHEKLAARGQNDALVAGVRQIRARMDAPARRIARAEADLELCLDNARTSGDRAREGTVLLDLGVVRHHAGALAEAGARYDAALPLLRESGDLVAEARCLGNRGALCHDEGDLAGAARYYREAIVELEEAGEARHRGNLASNLAVLEQELGKFAEARELFELSIALLEPIRDSRLLAIALGNLGVLELEVGAYDAALALHERSRALLAGSEDARSQALCLARVGATLALLGKSSDAEMRFARADRLAVRADATVVETVELARAFLHLGRARRTRAARSDADRVRFESALDAA